MLAPPNSAAVVGGSCAFPAVAASAAVVGGLLDGMLTPPDSAAVVGGSCAFPAVAASAAVDGVLVPTGGGAAIMAGSRVCVLG